VIAIDQMRQLGIEPETALRKANDKFTRRFGAVEQLATKRGIELGRAKLEELDRLWDEVKARG